MDIIGYTKTDVSFAGFWIVSQIILLHGEKISADKTDSTW